MERTEELRNVESDKLAKEAVKLMLEKKGLDVKMYDVKDYTTVADYYVNVTGLSGTHVNSLADEIADNFDLRGQPAYRMEGKKGNSWILVDFGSVIVNVFDNESRNFYNFDKLLPAECQTDITELVQEVDKKFR